jgi:streptogramin lyase
MGGLAARAYLQKFTSFDPTDKVQSLITVGTPHDGSVAPYVCQAASVYSLTEPNLYALLATLPFCQNPFGKGMESLKPQSEGIKDLNDGLKSSSNNLPAIPVLSIVVGGKDTFTTAGIEPGDGIVTGRSQDLTLLPGRPGPLRNSISMVIPACSSLINPESLQTHTCETNDKMIWTTLLTQILGTPVTVSVSTGAPFATRTTTPQVTIQGDVYFETPLTNAFFRYGTSSSLLDLIAPTQSSTASSGMTRLAADNALSSTIQLSANLPDTLQPGTTYYYQLVAETGGETASGGQTAVGQVHEVTIPPVDGIGSLLVAPTGLSPASGATSQPLTPTLTWNTVPDAASFRIMLAQDASALPTDPTDGNCDRCLVNKIVHGAQGTSYTPPDGLLTDGTTYYWQVHARSADNFGAWTAPSSLTTQPAPPATLLPAPAQTGPADGNTGQTTMPTLSWTPVENATSYRIMIAPTAAALTTDPTTADCPGCVTNAVVSGGQSAAYVPYAGLLAVGSTYYWSIKARSPESYGEWSAVRSFTPTNDAQIITEFNSGTRDGCGPIMITTGPDGNLWFTDACDNSITRITPTGSFTAFGLGSVYWAGDSQTLGITGGPDGNLWFTKPSADKIGWITPEGDVTEFSLGSAQLRLPHSIVAGPDGNLWFTESYGYRIGRITPEGAITEFSTNDAEPQGITVGPDGNLWFTVINGNKIGRITPQGVITEFVIGVSTDSTPSFIAAGPDGNLWFTETYGNRIGRITPTGVVTEFSAGISPEAGPNGITAGPDGNLWFTETYGNRIGRITPTGVVTEFSAGISPEAGPNGITAGPDGNVWFTESNTNRIGRITLGGSTAAVTYDLAVANGGNGMVTGSPAGINCGATCAASYASGTPVTLTATPDYGFTFTGWSGDCSGNASTCTLSMDTSKNVIAAFSPSDTTPPTGSIIISSDASYTKSLAVTLTLSCSDSGSGCATMQLSNDAGANWSFEESYAQTKPLDLLPGDGTKTIYAMFKDAAGNWSAPVSDTIILDTAAPVTTPSTSGGTFNGARNVALSISEGGTIYYTTDGSDPRTSLTRNQYVAPIPVNASMTLKYYALDSAGNSEAVKTEIYTITYVLTATKNGTGTGTVTSSRADINCGATCSASYASGTSVTLTAIPDAGFIFAGWSGGGCSGTGTCVATMNTGIIITATFSTIGDLNDDGKIDLTDAIIAIQVTSSIIPTQNVYKQADVNGDGKIGLAGAIYALQCATRLRNNHSPVLTAIGNKAINEGSTLSFTITATDGDNDPLTFAAASLPSGAAFNASTRTFSWTPAYSQSGTYPVTFTADDGYGGTASETVNIVVNNKNRAPVLTSIGNKAIDESSTLTFSISAADADGDALTYAASTLPGGATFSAATKTFSWTPMYTQSGNYQITFTVSDDYGGSSSETIAISVNNKIPAFTAADYFPLDVGQWYDYNLNGVGNIRRNSITETKTIGGVPAKVLTYWSGDKEYYTSDQDGIKLYGQYSASTGVEALFQTSLFLMPNNSQVGSANISTSSYSFVYSGTTLHVNVTSTVSIMAVEDVQTENTTLKDCLKVSIKIDQKIVETGQTIPGSPIYYWFYKGIGCVKQIKGSDTYVIATSFVNGVEQTY